VTVIAHAGHWLPQLLYLAPLIVLVVAIVIGRMRERRDSNAADGHDDARAGDA
jgi:cytochrome c oxidase assembly factor CtaG